MKILPEYITDFFGDLRRRHLLEGEETPPSLEVMLKWAAAVLFGFSLALIA